MGMIMTLDYSHHQRNGTRTDAAAKRKPKNSYSSSTGEATFREFARHWPFRGKNGDPDTIFTNNHDIDKPSGTFTAFQFEKKGEKHVEGAGGYMRIRRTGTRIRTFAEPRNAGAYVDSVPVSNHSALPSLRSCAVPRDRQPKFIAPLGKKVLLCWWSTHWDRLHSHRPSFDAYIGLKCCLMAAVGVRECERQAAKCDAASIFMPYRY